MTSKFIYTIITFIFLGLTSQGQSPSFKTYMNPVIPGDHPDCTLTQVGDHYYTTGSSFNPTPVIYHSTDLVHWEAIAQPVSAAWTGYGDKPGGGCWGGQLIYRNNKYWHFFFRGSMHFVTANAPQGPWSTPTSMVCPPSVPGLGYDNSVFVDDDNKWYLVVKNGQVNNWIVQLGENGQPAGAIYDLRWLNPAPAYPYSWAEGPVMWKYKGYYFYSFARDVSGGQKVMRSDTLTADQTKWTMLGDFFNLNDPKKPQALFGNPNHSSAPIVLKDSTNWVVHPLWYTAGNDWRAQGRQGLLNQVKYNASVKPLADYPINEPYTAPKLPSSGIPWMVPKSDFFNKTVLNPEWSFSGYTPATTWSLSSRPGWLKLSPRVNKSNTVFKNDGEHNYSVITRVDFGAKALGDEAGIRLSAASDTIFVKVFSSVNASGKKVIRFNYYKTNYEVLNTLGDTLWLKLNRANHVLTGFYSRNGIDWTQVGSSATITTMDSNLDMANWSGQRQGLYVLGAQPAYFDLYIYRDAYSLIPSEFPANQYGAASISGILDNIHNNDWALYAGVEFQNKDYNKIVDSVMFTASSYTTGGFVEIWLDSIDTGEKIGTCAIQSTGSWAVYKTFKAKINPVTGRHDVYLKFTGTGSGELFQLKAMQFMIKQVPKYISSATTTDSTITISLNQVVSIPAIPTGFSVSVNDTDKLVITKVISGASDSLIILSFNQKIKALDNIKISYSNGNIKNSEGIELNPFTDVLVNNTIVGIIEKTGIDFIGFVRVYPNPAKTELNVVSDINFNVLRIYSTDGRLLFEKTFGTLMNTANISINFAPGYYLLKVGNSKTVDLACCKIMVE